MKRLKTLHAFPVPLPDDLHHHFRDLKSQGDGRLSGVAKIVAEKFGRCLAMPNLSPPVTTVDQALAYRERILSCVPSDLAAQGFDPLMTLYLTDNTKVEEIERIPQTEGRVVACKLYPQGATTNSSFGVSQIGKIKPVLAKMQELQIPLCIHGEVVGKEVDPFDREKVFLETQLQPLMDEFPSLKIILEHITTKESVDFVMNCPSPRLAATITPQHLLYDRSALFSGAGLRPHMYCLPILKRGNPHRLALLGAIASGSPKFFLGTDSAPHAKSEKEKDCGCAGCFTAFNALELYLEAFEECDSLDKFENFACHYGARFYGLPEVKDRAMVWCEKKPLSVPAHFELEGGGKLVPLRAGETCAWTVSVIKD